MVTLLNREDAYERERKSPRAGEADLILGEAPQRPEQDSDGRIQGRYSRFVNMASTAPGDG